MQRLEGSVSTGVIQKKNKIRNVKILLILLFLIIKR